MEDAKNLINEFTSRIGLGKPAYADNIASVQFDEMILNFHADDPHNEVTLFMDMGAVPTEETPRLALYSLLLRANNFGRETGGGILGIDSAERRVSLCRTFSIHGMRIEQFEGVVEAFLNLAESMRARIGEAAAARSATDVAAASAAFPDEARGGVRA